MKNKLKMQNEKLKITIKNSKFFGQVYQLVKQIPRGKVTTYGRIAGMLGTRDARKVGWALHGNTDKDCPCHRVVNKDGRVALNYSFAGWKEQERRLVAEGVEFVDEKRVDLVNCKFDFRNLIW